jgi:hypothetical protein
MPVGAAGGDQLVVAPKNRGIDLTVGSQSQGGDAVGAAHIGGNRTGAQEQLLALLAGDLRPAEKAAVYYELWGLAADGEYGRRALTHYQQLAAQSSNSSHHRRLANLQTALEKSVKTI